MLIPLPPGSTPVGAGARSPQGRWREPPRSWSRRAVGRSPGRWGRGCPGGRRCPPSGQRHEGRCPPRAKLRPARVGAEQPGAARGGKGLGPRCRLSVGSQPGPAGSTWPRPWPRWLQPPGGMPAWGGEGRPGARGQGHEEVTLGRPARGLPPAPSRGPTSWPPCQGLLVRRQPLFREPPLGRPRADLRGSSGSLVTCSSLLPLPAWGRGSSGGVQGPVSLHRGSLGCSRSRAVGWEHRWVSGR